MSNFDNKLTFKMKLYLGGCPYPNVPGREIAGLLEQGYRIPKPQHLDQHL